jgi:lincosamide nucleotidyltransferase A/C/D/E
MEKTTIETLWMVLEALKERGYVLEKDWLPVRAELAHSQYGYLDIHPFVIG